MNNQSAVFKRRAFVTCATGGLAGALSVLGMLLGISLLIEAASVYPNSRRVADEGLRLFAECPTYGARVGSVRSPLCRWSIGRTSVFETDDPMTQVYHWYAAPERVWGIQLGRLVIQLSLASVRPARRASAPTRFVVETRFQIDLLQR